MGFLDKFMNFGRPYSAEEDYDYDEENEEYEEAAEADPRPRRSSPFATSEDAEPSYADTGRSFSGQVLGVNSNKQEVVLFHAKSFDDAARAADELRKKKAVILNMENVDKSLTRRVVDFLSGSVYALDGSVKKIAQSTYLFCPHNMAVVGDLENIQSEIESYI